MGTRQNKIARLIQKEIAVIFQQYAQNIYPGGMVTVTVVRITPDLGLAKVYLSIFPSNKKDEVMEYIHSNTKNFRHALSQTIRSQLKKMPELQFFVDDSLDYIENIENLLKK